jgi:hypothetical protein
MLTTVGLLLFYAKKHFLELSLLTSTSFIISGGVSDENMDPLTLVRRTSTTTHRLWTCEAPLISLCDKGQRISFHIGYFNDMW